MFVGHYGISFAAKSAEKTIPLCVLFVEALAFYLTFAAVAGWLERRRV